MGYSHRAAVQLTQFTDFALRALLYLAVHRERTVPAAEISAAYGISSHHLVKVAHQLVRLGFVEAVRGRGGGLRLARDPATIRAGEVIRATEPNFNIVECFDRDHNTCPIVPACELVRALARAREAFLAELDAVPLSALTQDPKKVERLTQIWRRQRAAAE